MGYVAAPTILREVTETSPVAIICMKLTIINKLSVKEQGASLVEYSVLIALVLLVAIIGIGAVGEKVAVKFDDVTEELAVGGGAVQCDDTLPPGHPEACT